MGQDGEVVDVLLQERWDSASASDAVAATSSIEDAAWC
jgi:hypothetical protein